MGDREREAILRREVSFVGVNFDILSVFRAVTTIASGRALRDRRRLARQYGRGNWRKMKGIATVRIEDGTILEAELHWYEAHGIGKQEVKFKKPIGPGK